MLDQKVFEKFDLLPMSFSKLNSFSNYPCQFIINKIYKVDTGTNPAMRVGHLVEEMLHEKIIGKEPDLALYQNKLEEELCDYHDQSRLNDYIDYIPKFYKQCLPLFDYYGNYQLQSYQEELKTKSNVIEVVELKEKLPTKGRIAFTSSGIEEIGLKVGDVVGFKENRDYRIKIDGKEYYRTRIEDLLYVENDG